MNSRFFRTGPPGPRRSTAGRRAGLTFFCGFVTAMASVAPESQDLFVGGEGGYAVYRIPGLVVTANGTALAVCEARRDGPDDWGTMDILLRRSTDGGRNWAPPRRLAHEGPVVPRSPVALERKLGQPDDRTVNNPVLIVGRKPGSVVLLYCVEYARCFVRRSQDDGATFSPPEEITGAFEVLRPVYNWRVLATGPGHGVALRSGRLVVPVWLALGTAGNGHKPSLTTTVYSDDGGVTWKAGSVALPDTAEFRTPSETCLVELSDGRVMLNARSLSPANRRLVTTGPDGAGGWASPWFDPALLEPICMASLVRYSTVQSGGRDRILFSNPDNLATSQGKPTRPGQPGARRNLSIKLSYDEGITWPVNKVLELGSSAYSDLAVTADGTILCVFERTFTDPATRRRIAALSLARFTLEWLTDGKDCARIP